jgi:hypothetical protein
VQDREIALGDLAIERKFDRTSWKTIEKTAEQHGVQLKVQRNKTILSGGPLNRTTYRCCS